VTRIAAARQLDVQAAGVVARRPVQGPTPLYDSCWVEDVKKIGAENYYPKLKL